MNTSSTHQTIYPLLMDTIVFYDGYYCTPRAVLLRTGHPKTGLQQPRSRDQCLVEAMDYCKASSGYIITMEDHGDIESGNHKIQVMNAVSFFEKSALLLIQN